jgi:Lrp/AsnC family transcriptional regulator for asnA, asnC and gidA
MRSNGVSFWSFAWLRARILRVAQPVLDAVDESILEALQADGRRSFRDIARGVGVSEGTVRARVRRLQEAGILRVLAFVDPSRLGQRVLALLLARVEAEHQQRVVDAATAWPETTYVSSLVGRVDVYMQVICADNETLWSVVRRLRSLPGVLETETMLEMEVHKCAYRALAERERAVADG